MLRWGKVEVTGGFLLMAAALFYLDGENLLPWAALACGLHELGHLLSAYLLGGRIERFRLTAVGGELRLDGRKPLTYGRELAALLAGPAANLMSATVAARFAGGERAWLFAGLSLTLGVFNLLPVYPLDGGRALLLILEGLFPEPWASRLARGCSWLTAAGLLAAGLTGLRSGWGNPTLITVGLWLAAGTALGDRDLPRPYRRRNRRPQSGAAGSRLSKKSDKS